MEKKINTQTSFSIYIVLLFFMFILHKDVYVVVSFFLYKSRYDPQGPIIPHM